MLVNDAREAIRDESPLDRVRSLISELQQVLQGLMSRVGAGVGAGPSRGGPGSAGAGGSAGSQGSGAGSDDDVVDAEFDRS